MLISFQSLPADAKVWVYQSSSELSEYQSLEIKTELYDFLREWTAHSAQLYTTGDVLHHRFVVVMVDESKVGTSGCSLDKLTHFIQRLEQKYGISLLDRMTVAYESANNIQTCHLHDLPKLIQDQAISEDTLVFDNLVNNKAAFETQWKKSIKDSWHKRFI